MLFYKNFALLPHGLGTHFLQQAHGIKLFPIMQLYVLCSKYLLAKSCLTVACFGCCCRCLQDITLSTEVTVGEGFKSTLNYERQTWIVEGRARRESRYPNVRYSGLVRLSSPTSSVDVQLTSNAAVDAETSSRQYALKYLTSRDQQLKTLALKTEINRLRKELKLEVGKRTGWLQTCLMHGIQTAISQQPAKIFN